MTRQTFTPHEAATLALRCLDLTSLNDGDTETDIVALSQRAQSRYGNVAAVCVWPRFVALARRLLPPTIAVAAVANFPGGAMDVDRALADVHQIVAAGGNEVDVVLPYSALMHDGRQADKACADFLAAVRTACGPLTLKVIIESGALQTDALITQATALALDAGADFVKTSTGKILVSATPQAAAVMLKTISTSGKTAVGFKASGGIRTVADAKTYLALVADAWGPGAITPERVRFGASGLLTDIEAVLSGAASELVAAPTAPSGY